MMEVRIIRIVLTKADGAGRKVGIPDGSNPETCPYGNIGQIIQR